MADLPDFSHLPPLPPKPVNTRQAAELPAGGTKPFPPTPEHTRLVKPLEPRPAPIRARPVPIAGPLPVLPGAAAFREPDKELNLEGDIEFLEEPPLPKTRSGATTKFGTYTTNTTLNPYTNTTPVPKNYNKTTIGFIIIGSIILLGIGTFVTLNIINMNSTPELKPIPVITVNPDDL